MRQMLCVSAAILGLIGFGAAARGADAKPTNYKVECRMAEYNWVGLKKTGGVIGVTTEEARPASAFAGETRAIANGDRQESIDVGATFRFVVRRLHGGRVRLDSTAEYSWLESAPGSADLRMQSMAKRSIETLRLGDLYRIELQNSEKDGSCVFEITVEEADAAAKK